LGGMARAFSCSRSARTAARRADLAGDSPPCKRNEAVDLAPLCCSRATFVRAVCRQGCSDGRRGNHVSPLASAPGLSARSDA
jgi:hypothetical protein